MHDFDILIKGGIALIIGLIFVLCRNWYRNKQRSRQMKYRYDVIVGQSLQKWADVENIPFASVVVIVNSFLFKILDRKVDYIGLNIDRCLPDIWVNKTAILKSSFLIKKDYTRKQYTIVKVSLNNSDACSPERDVSRMSFEHFDVMLDFIKFRFLGSYVSTIGG